MLHDTKQKSRSFTCARLGLTGDILPGEHNRQGLGLYLSAVTESGIIQSPKQAFIQVQIPKGGISRVKSGHVACGAMRGKIRLS